MFKSIKDILPKSIKKAGIKDKVEDGLAISKFNRIVAEVLEIKIKNKLRPLYLKQGFLVVACLDNELVKKLRSKENEIISKINWELRKTVVRGLRFLE